MSENIPFLTGMSGNPLADDDLQRLFQRGIAELESVIGEISPLIARARLRFVYTGGSAAPPQSSRPAAFVPEDDVIYFGSYTRESHENRGLIFCGHEIGHWLDHIAGPTVSQSEKLLDATWEDVPIAQSLASFIRAQQVLKGDASVIDNGVALMNPPENFPRFASVQKTAPGYFARPSEVFGRLFEQWIACELYRQGIRRPVFVYPFPTYIRAPGCWSLDAWEQIQEQAGCLIQTALDRARWRSQSNFLRYQRQWKRHYELVRAVAALLMVNELV